MSWGDYDGCQSGGLTPSDPNPLSFVRYFKNDAALDAWSSANQDKLTNDLIVLVLENADNGFAQWYRYDTSVSDFVRDDISGIVAFNSNGSYPLRYIEFTPELEITSPPENPLFGEISMVKFLRNTAPVTTFFKATGLNKVINPGDTVDLINEFFAEYTEQFVASTGADIRNVANDPFTSFLSNVNSGHVVFPDVDTTTTNVIDIREVAVSCRISGIFGGNLDSVVLVDYYQLTPSSALDVKIGTMAFERQFAMDFEARAQSIVSRLSKQTSTLVQNGAKFIMSVPAGAPSTFTLSEVDFLITVGG